MVAGLMVLAVYAWAWWWAARFALSRWGWKWRAHALGATSGLLPMLLSSFPAMLADDPQRYGSIWPAAPVGVGLIGLYAFLFRVRPAAIPATARPAAQPGATESPKVMPAALDTSLAAHRDAVHTAIRNRTPAQRNAVERERRLDAARRPAPISLTLPMLLSFEYTDRDGVITQRTVLARQLSRAGQWQYIEGDCQDRGQERTFRTDRIIGALVHVATGRRVEVQDLFAGGLPIGFYVRPDHWKP